MLVGLALLFLAGQVARGKRRAWQISIGLFALGVVTNILKGPHPISAAYCAGMVIALISYRRAVPRAVRPALAVAARPPRAAVHRRGARLRLHQPHGRTQPPRWRRSDVRRWPGDDRQGRGRRRRSVHVPAPVLPRLLPGRPADARRRRRGRRGVPAVPSAAGARVRTPRTTGRTRAGSCGSTARTRWPTSPCATTRASSSAPTARRSIAYTYLGGFALASGDPIGADALDRPRPRRVHRVLHATLVAGGLPRRAHLRAAPLRGPRAAQLLSRRRSHRRVRHVQPGRPRHEGRAGRRPPGGADLPLRGDPRIAGVRRPGRDSSTRSASSGGARRPSAGFTMSLSQDIEGGGPQPRVPALRRPRREGRARRVPAHRAGVRRRTSATRST